MNSSRNLKLLQPDFDDTDTSTRQSVARAAIAQSHREYRSSSGDISNPQGWQTMGQAEKPLDVDGIVLRGTKLVVTDAPVSWRRKVVRWWRGL